MTMAERRRHALPVAFATALLALGWTSISFAQHPVQNLAPGQWYQVPNSKMSSIDPCPGGGCSYSANEGQRGVMDDWSGGAFATGLGSMGSLLVFGGGHNGYYGNEVYAFDIAKMTWSLVTQPVQNPDCNYTEGELQNGSPCSAHTYDYIEYHPGTNSFVKLGSASDHDRGGLGSPRVHLLNLDSRTWRRGARKPTFPGVNGEGGYGMTGASSAYDPNRDVFWVLPAYNSRFAKYDPNAASGAGQWTEYNRYNIDIDAMSAIDPTRDLFVTLEALLTQSVIVHDLKNPSAEGYTVNISGDLTPMNNKGNGFVWDSVSKAFVAWTGGTAVYKLTPPSGDWKSGTWVWTKVNAASTNTVTPTSVNMNDTYSRFQYVPALNAFVVVNRNTDNVYFYKLSNSVAQPTITLSASPTSVGTQGSSELTWSTSNANACTASGGWTGAKATSGSEMKGPLTASTSYTLACSSSAGGSASRSVTVSVASATPAPTVTFSASPLSIPLGGATTLSWTSSNATSCTGSGGSTGWAGSKATTGSQSIASLTAATTFTLACTGAGGTTTRTAAVSLTSTSTTPPPTMSLTASPTSVTAGGQTTLTWSSTNATSCAASGSWAGNKGTSGSELSAALSAAATFTLQCTGAGGVTSRSVPVSITSTTPTDPAASGTDWTTRSKSTGVVQAVKFTQALVDQGRFANNYDPKLLANVVFNATGGVDGKGGLRINVPSSTGEDPGAWRTEFPRFWGSGLNTMKFYVQFRFRVSSGRTTGCQSGDGWKIANISSYNRSLTAYEVVPWNSFNEGNLLAYYGGSPPFLPNPNPAFKMPENEWITVYFEIQAAKYDGASTSNRMIMKAARQNATQWSTLYNLTGGDWFGSEGDDGFSGLWFTPYSTNRDPNVCPSGWHEYDELIVSTQPIALPGQGTTTTPPPPAPTAPTVTLSASPTSVAAGARSTLTWSSTNATSCTASGAWAGNKGLAGSEQSPTLNQNSTFTLACTGAGGTTSRSASVTVAAASTPAPIVTLGASPTSVAAGGKSTLTWSATNATSCTASGAWTGAKAVSGTELTAALSQASTFTLACTGAGGSSSKSVTVSMTSTTPPPTEPPTTSAPVVQFGAWPGYVRYGSSSALWWSATNATSCTASGGWTGTKATRGTQRTSRLTQTTIFTLRCTGAGGATSKSVTVYVRRR
jgi:hypothetical protein